jgi:formamidopyrimidine-DNA glycosylase
MPEVIEVREYADFLLRKVKGEKIKKILILKGRYKKHKPFDGFKDLSGALPLKILDIDNKGKFMYIHFSNDFYLGISLGLTGGWFYKARGSKRYIHGLNGERYVDTDIDDSLHPSGVQKTPTKAEKYYENALKHLNVEFVCESGSFYFYDQLSFGSMMLFSSREELDKKLKTLGVDIMKPETTFELFLESMTHKTNMKKAIGNALMNQKRLSGVGNYLRADALWVAKINPFRKVGDLSHVELKRLYHALRLLIWGQYNRKRGVQLNIIGKRDKLPQDYGRTFFVYQQDEDIYGKVVKKEQLYEGSQIRYIYYCE